MSMEKADRCRQREPTWAQPLALAVQGATIEQPGSVYDARTTRPFSPPSEMTTCADGAPDEGIAASARAAERRRSMGASVASGGRCRALSASGSGSFSWWSSNRRNDGARNRPPAASQMVGAMRARAAAPGMRVAPITCGPRTSARAAERRRRVGACGRAATVVEGRWHGGVLRSPCPTNKCLRESCLPAVGLRSGR
jgi:hypothetical protein